MKQYGRLYTLPQSVYELFSDKGKTNELARTAGIPVPREIKVETAADLERFAPEISNFGYPLIFKPISSVDYSDLSGRRTVVTVRSTADVNREALVMLQRGPFLVQEFVRGRGVGVELLLDESRPLMVFQHERVHEPLNGGGSSYRRSVPVSDHLLNAALKLFEGVKYTGVAMVEFKVDHSTGAWYLMEVNARFWGSLPLAVAAGADFPYALYRLIVDQVHPDPTRYRKGVYCRNLRQDLAWQWRNFKADKRDSTLATRPILKVVRDAIVNNVLMREKLDTVTWDDPRPGLVEMKQLFGLAIRALTKRVKRLAWSLSLRLPILQRSMARRLEQAFAKSASVLFVCKGNICRSPFAEKYATQMWGSEISVSSAGYHPVAGRSSPEEAITVAAKWDVDLAEHSSRILSESMIKGADLVLVFDVENYVRVRQDYSYYSRRIFFIGSFCSGTPVIRDPWGSDEATFRETYERIAWAITSATEMLRAKKAESK